MKKIKNTNELTALTNELDIYQSIPVLLSSPELFSALSAPRSQVQIVEKDFYANIVSVEPEVCEDEEVFVGVQRTKQGDKITYEPLEEKWIPTGFTLITEEDFDTVTEDIKSDDFGKFNLSSFKDGDLLWFHVYKTAFGAGITLTVNTGPLMQDLPAPIFVVNPRSISDWDYLFSLAEMEIFSWGFTDGKRMMIFHSTRSYFSALVRRVQSVATAHNQSIPKQKRDFKRVFEEMRKFG